jgi:hypothetical protein
MKNAVSGLGLAPDAAMVTFPIDMFLPGSDISPLERRKREVYDGLTRWKSDFVQAAPGAAAMLTVEGASYEDALVKANHYLLTNLWSGYSGAARCRAPRCSANFRRAAA